jgi:hypothetical protein
MNPPHTGYSLVPQKYKDIYKDVPLESLTDKPNIPPAGTKWGDHYRKNIKDYVTTQVFTHNFLDIEIDRLSSFYGFIPKTIDRLFKFDH